MTHRLSPHVLAFAMNDVLYASALSAVDQADADRRASPSTNSLQGIAAHLAAARHGLATLLDIEVDPLPWTDLGEGFEAGFVEREDFPDLATIRGAWDAATAALTGGMERVGEEVLARPSPIPIPGIEAATLAEFAALNVVHESYHLGQLGLIVKEATGKGIMTPQADGTPA